MQLTIRFSGGDRSHFGNHEYEEILADTLQRFRDRLKRVALFIEDVNGPKGGVDKQCRCVLHLRRMPPVVISDKSESTSALIHRVANRAVHTLSKKLDRRIKRARTRRLPEPDPE